MLQIVIFAQTELERRLVLYPNFSDRINLTHPLGPMNFADTRAMIRYRLNQSGRREKESCLFTLAALWAIYLQTRGYPRRIIHLCHQCLLSLIIQNRSKVDWFTVRSCGFRNRAGAGRTGRRLFAAAVAAVALLCIAAAVSTENVRRLVSGSGRALESASLRLKPVPPETRKPEPAIEPNSEDRKNERYYEMPAGLGDVMLEQNETLWSLIKKVYGGFDMKRFHALKAANPSIKDPDRLETGQTVHLPAVPLKGIEAQNETWHVELGKFKLLSAAMDLLNSFRRQGISVRLIPYWNSREGLQFSLILKEHFSSEAEAKGRLTELPPPLESKGCIRKGWGEGTVFFSNPGIR